MVTVFFNHGVCGASFTERKVATLADARRVAAELFPSVIIEAGAPRRTGRALRPTLIFNLFAPDAHWTGSTPGKRPIGMITV